jgi:hypothetical protein
LISALCLARFASERFCWRNHLLTWWAPHLRCRSYIGWILCQVYLAGQVYVRIVFIWSFLQGSTSKRALSMSPPRISTMLYWLMLRNNLRTGTCKGGRLTPGRHTVSFKWPYRRSRPSHL